MFDKIMGLPAHPLIVHAPVVLIPLTFAFAVAYCLVPRFRRHLGWLLAAFAVASAAGAFAAAESGKAFRANLNLNTAAIQHHESLGLMLRNISLLLAVVALLLVGIDIMRRRQAKQNEHLSATDADVRVGSAPGAAVARPRSGNMLLGAVSVVLSIALLALAVTALVYVVITGHSGAEIVWGPR